MTQEQRKEALRQRLAQQMAEDEAEWNFVAQIVLLAKEMNIDTDEVFEWTIMKFDIVSKAIQEFYEAQYSAMPSSESKAQTLGE